MNSTWAPRFWGALRNNLTLFVIHMFVQIPVALLLAACLNSQFLRWRAIYRTLLFTPAMLSIAIVGFIWQLILNPLWGVSKSLMNLVGIGSLFRPWLGLQDSALTTISLISVWQFLGIPMLLFVTALITIPEELIEAARVDGANAWNCFWKIQFPLILPTIGIVTILTYTGNMNGFDLVFAVEGPLGGPNYRTDLMGTLLYRTFFGFQNGVANPYMGSTIATMMFVITIIGVLIYLFILQRRIVSYDLKMGAN
jgi:raffinose/stachyose/melibiose transport system permease protein